MKFMDTAIAIISVMLLSACSGEPPKSAEVRPPMPDPNQQSIQATDREKRELLQVLIREQSLGEFLREYKRGVEAAAREMKVSKIDLNQDGQAEYVIDNVLGRTLCGASGNCSSFVYQKTSGGYRFLLEGNGFGIKLLQTSTNGYRDLSTESHSSADETYLTIYKFDGNKYQEKDCYINKYNKSKRISSEKCGEPLK
jgi:hypothetical protein